MVKSKPNWGPKSFEESLWLAIKLESKFTVIQDLLNQSLNNWSQLLQGKVQKRWLKIKVFKLDSIVQISIKVQTS